MCGLVGAIVNDNRWTLSKAELDIFTNLLYASALRGAHSTGIMWTDGETNHMLKMATHPADFIFTKEYQNILVPNKIKGIFGHTRYATSGKINAKNAHPFKVKNRVILMHNGNVTKVIDSVANEFEVDSMALADALSREDPNKVFESFDGAVACIWFDNQNNSVNFYRNYQRPLNYTANGVTKFIASEEQMLRWIVGRSQWQGQAAPVIKELAPMHHMMIQLDSLDKVSEQKIDRKYNQSFFSESNRHSSKWPHYGVNDIDYDGEDEYGDPPFRRRSNTSYGPIHKTDESNASDTTPTTTPTSNQSAPSHLRVVGKVGTLSLPKENPSLKKSPYMKVAKDGPFITGQTMVFVAYDSEEYEYEDNRGGKHTKVKVKLTPIIGTDKKEYDIPRYTSVPCEAFGYTTEEVKKFLEGGFVTGQVVNILFNSDYVDEDDRITVYLANLTLISKEGAIVNGN